MGDGYWHQFREHLILSHDVHWPVARLSGMVNLSTGIYDYMRKTLSVQICLTVKWPGTSLVRVIISPDYALMGQNPYN